MQPKTLNELIDHARRHISEAEGWVWSDWSDDPSRRQIIAFKSAMRHLADAKDAMDDARPKPHMGERA